MSNRFPGDDTPPYRADSSRQARHRGSKGSRSGDPYAGLRDLQESMSRPASDRGSKRGGGAHAVGASSNMDDNRAGVRGGIPGGPGGAPQIMSRRQRRRLRRKSRSVALRILRVSIVLLVLLTVGAGSGLGYYKYVSDKLHKQACADCVVPASGAPYNILIIGSDSRAGETASEAQSFGSASKQGEALSDTIKVLHVDPSAGSADLISIPRDSYVRISAAVDGATSNFSSLAGTDQKINAAFEIGPESLIATVENTLGIPVSHFVILGLNGVINLVNAVGGIKMDFPYPARDNDNGNNNSGLNITHAGCQVLNGTMALALSRSRYYEYEVYPYHWVYDPTGDLGRIQRQNFLIKSVVDKAKASYNPFTLNAFLQSLLGDVTVDQGMSFGTLVSLAERYHAFSGNALTTYTLPTLGAQNGDGDVEIIQEPEAQSVIAQFLGGAPQIPTTPPLSASGYYQRVTTTTTTTTAPQVSSTSTGSSSAPPSTTTTVVAGQNPGNPTPC